MLKPVAASVQPLQLLHVPADRFTAELPTRLEVSADPKPCQPYGLTASVQPLQLFTQRITAAAAAAVPHESVQPPQLLCY